MKRLARRRALIAGPALVLGGLSVAWVTVGAPGAGATPSYNPAPADSYHAPLSSAALLAVAHAQGRLAAAAGSGRTAPGAQPAPSGGAAPLTFSGISRFESDLSYMPQSETTVAVDPANAGHVVGGFNDSRWFLCPLVPSADCPSGWTNSITGFSVSADSGASVLKADDLPGVDVGKTFLMSWGDPDVVPASQGNFYFSSLAIDPNTGDNGVELAVSNANLWKTSPVTPCNTATTTPAKNPCWKSVFVSGDTSSFPSTLADKPLIAVDRSTSARDRYRGDVYVGWDHFNPDGTSASYLARCTPNLACTLVAGGAAAPVSGNDSFAAYTTPAVGADGTVYVTWCDYGTPTSLTPVDCESKSSPPGGTAFPSTATQIMSTSDSRQSLVGYATEQFRTASTPVLAVDPISGRLYFVIDVCDSGNYLAIANGFSPGLCGASEVLESTSTNGGASWSPPAPVSATTGVTAQPWVTVDPTNGTAHVTYYSSQNDPFNHRLDLYDTTSSDGSTWSVPVRLTTTSIEPDADPNYFAYFSSFGGSFVVPQFGDYIQATALNGTLYALFAATYTPELGTFKTSPFLYVGTG